MLGSGRVAIRLLQADAVVHFKDGSDWGLRLSAGLVFRMAG